MGRSNKIVPQLMCNWLLLLVFVLQFVVSLAVGNIWGILSSKPLKSYGYILIVEVLAVTLPALLLCVFNESAFTKTFAVKSIKFSKAWKCFCLGVCLQPVAIVANVLWQNITGFTSSATETAVSAGWGGFAAGFVFACVIPAFCEEFLIRGMYLSAVKKKGYVFTIITCTVMFVLLHADPSLLVAHAILGGMAAYVVLGTNSVFSGVLLHIGFNLCGILVDFALGKFPDMSSFGFYIVSGCFGLLFTLLLTKILFRKKIRKIASKDIGVNLFKALFNLPILIIIIIYIYRIVG